MRLLGKIALASTLAAILVGCGGGDSNDTPATSDGGTQSVTGVFIDDVVSGIRYVNGTRVGITDEQGQFSYTSGTIDFYLGNIHLGTISQLPQDKRVFVQDLVGVDRTETNSSDVMTIASLLQALDSNSSTEAIEIDQAGLDALADLNGSLFDIQNLAFKVQDRGYPFPKEAQVKGHLDDMLKKYAVVSDTTQPSLVQSSITNNQINVELDEEIELEFSESIPKEYLTSSYITLTASDNTPVDINISKYTNFVDITPSLSLNNDETYTLSISGDIEDYAGNRITQASSISFSTLASGTQNEAPQISIAGGLSQSVVQGQSITIDASGTTDDSNGVITYEFLVLDGTTTVDGTQGSSATSSFTIDTTNLQAGSYSVIVTAYDTVGASSQATVALTITAAPVPNVAPTANAGADQAVAEGDSVTLSASASSDSDGSIISYRWAEGSTVLANSSSFSKNDFSIGIHTLTLTVTDDDGATDSDTVVITVDAAAPTLSPNAFVIDINTSLEPLSSFASSANQSTTTDTEFHVNNYKFGSILRIDCDTDGSAEATINYTESYKCTYPTPGAYTVSIIEQGTTSTYINFGSLSTPSTLDTHKITKIRQWGTTPWGDMSYMFRYANNLEGIEPTAGVPDFSRGPSLSYMFYYAVNFNADLSLWDVSNIVNLSRTFAGTYIFNGDVSTWDTSSVTNMGGTFSVARAFNQDIGSWDTSKVTTMQQMFEGALVFNQDISSWDVSSVTGTGMAYMFSFANAFNQDLSSWDVSGVTNMAGIFRNNYVLDQDLSLWDVSGVTNCTYSFTGATIMNNNPAKKPNFTACTP